MNIVITVFSLFFLLKLIRRKVPVSRKSRFMLYLGVVSPGLDYLLRFAWGEIWFQTEGLIFHSLIYQTVFWGIVALLVWVYTRRLRIAAGFLLPLAGLMLYALFCCLSTESVTFLAPLSKAAFNLGWITAGYIVPTVLMLIFWLVLLFSDLPETPLSMGALLALVVFVGYAAISYSRINRSLAAVFPESDIVSVFAENHQQTMWRVVAFRNSRYLHTRFHFVQGQYGDVRELKVLNDGDTAQSALLDPAVRMLFQRAFRNPLIQVDVQNESMLISISELVPLIEPLWIKQLQIRKGGSGWIEHVEVVYGTVL